MWITPPIHRVSSDTFQSIIITFHFAPAAQSLCAFPQKDSQNITTFQICVHRIHCGFLQFPIHKHCKHNPFTLRLSISMILFSRSTTSVRSVKSSRIWFIEQTQTNKQNTEKESTKIDQHTQSARILSCHS